MLNDFLTQTQTTENTKLQSCPHNITLWTTLCLSIGPQNWKKNLFLWKSFHGSQPFCGQWCSCSVVHFLGPLEENFEFDFEFFIFLFLEEAFLLSLMWVWHRSFICWRWVVKKKRKKKKEKCIYYLVKSEIKIELNQKKRGN